MKYAIVIVSLLFVAPVFAQTPDVAALQAQIAALTKALAMCQGAVAPVSHYEQAYADIIAMADDITNKRRAKTFITSANVASGLASEKEHDLSAAFNKASASVGSWLVSVELSEVLQMNETPTQKVSRKAMFTAMLKDLVVARDLYIKSTKDVR